MEQIDGIGDFTPLDERDKENWQLLRGFVAREPNCFGRDPKTDHVTGSAFVLSKDHQSVLLTHHAKLNMWLQLGGHCDGIADAAFVALKEAYEESGLSRIRPLGRDVFDVDIQVIPANSKEAEHVHYDVRFLFVAEAGHPVVSAESKALKWVRLSDLDRYTQAPSVLLLRDKLSKRTV